MRNSYIILSSLIFLSALTGCEKTDSVTEPPSPYEATEKSIREEFDNSAVFPWSDYHKLMQKLTEEKFTVLPLNEMRNHFDPAKVVVGLRHDMDFNAFRGLEMANIEKSYGIRSTYFVLATAKYYGVITHSGVIRNVGMDSLYRRIAKRGGEIGIHNDLLTIMITHGLNPFEFNKAEIDWYKSINIKIHGTASHGSPIARATVTNYQIFSDFAKQDSIHYEGKKYPIGLGTLAEFGYDYEAYFINFSSYISDSGGKWNNPEGFTGVINQLDRAKPGDRIQILVHPDWWGRKW